MSTVVTVIHVLVCLFLMLTVLLQPGKGGGMGAAFGGGGSSSGTVFGGAGAGGFLRKVTVVSAVMFMLTSMTLAWIASTSGADALKRYSAQQRQAAELKQEARLEAVGGDAGAMPEGEGEGVILEEEEGLIPEGEEGLEGGGVSIPEDTESTTDTESETETGTETESESETGTETDSEPEPEPETETETETGTETEAATGNE